MANLGNVGGTFNLGYFDGGTRGDAPGGTNRGGAQRPAFKKLSKNPFKLRLVREKQVRQCFGVFDIFCVMYRCVECFYVILCEILYI